MNTKQLRQKILDLAIRGKLVPQDPNDEPASVLLARVKAEKERLIADGKIKRSKKTTTTTDKPHYAEWELPKGWVWCKLKDICAFLSRGKSPKYADNIKQFPVFAQKCNLKDGGISLEKARFLDPATIEKWDTVYKLRTGDILINSTGTGTVCRTRLFNDSCLGDYPFVVPDSHVSVVRTFDEISSEFIFYCISNTDIQQYLTDNLAGSTNQKELYIGVLEELLLPLPPKNEQKRIAKEIENSFSKIEILDCEIKDCSSIISQVKSKVLELAISGKLVSQDPADEPAADLLKRVNPNAVVSADTSHYQHLPQGWCVCKLEDIVDYEQPQRYIVESTDYNDTYKTPVLTAGKSFVIGYTNEKAGIFNNLPVIIFDDFTTDSKYVDFPFKVKSSAMKILHVKNGVNVKYVYYFMSITRLVGKTHKRYWISEYSKLNIPLPPYNEQCRIVDAVENSNRRIDDIAEAL